MEKWALFLNHRVLCRLVAAWADPTGIHQGGGHCTEVKEKGLDPDRPTGCADITE